MINQNKEIKKLLTKLNILADDKGYEKFLDNYFFNDECFLFKLEMLILNDYNNQRIKVCIQDLIPFAWKPITIEE